MRFFAVLASVLLACVLACVSAAEMQGTYLGIGIQWNVKYKNKFNRWKMKNMEFIRASVQITGKEMVFTTELKDGTSLSCRASNYVLEDMAWDETDPLAETGRAIGFHDGIVGTGCTEFLFKRNTTLTYDPVNNNIRFKTGSIETSLGSVPTDPFWSKGTPGNCQPDDLAGHGHGYGYEPVSTVYNSFEQAKDECRRSSFCSAVYKTRSGQYNMRYCFLGSQDKGVCNCARGDKNNGVLSDKIISNPICNKEQGGITFFKRAKQ